MFDYILKGGTVLDGLGGAPFEADIGIRNGKIAEIGAIRGEGRVLDVKGYTVTPGFLDIHRHGDAAAFREGYGKLELKQGLTTVVNGACGLSLAPFGPERQDEILHYLQPVIGEVDPKIPTDSLGHYLDALKALPINVGMMVGDGTVRTDTCGYRKEDPDDFGQIHRRLEKALSEGALAVSLGLGYAPECFYSTESLIKALEPLRDGNIPITVHMREEGDMVCDAVAEMITVAGALNCPLHISHLKAMGKRNWGKKIPRALKLMEEARQKGLDVSCDVYPYEAGTTQLLHVLPPDFLEGGVDAISARLRQKDQRDVLRDRIKNGHDFDNIAQLAGWDNIVISSVKLPQYQKLIGKTVEESAEILGLDPVDCLCQVLADERCTVTMIDRIACDSDISLILQDPFASVISDSTYPTAGLPHPRVYGTYVRLLEKFVLHDHVISLPEAIRKVTSLPAESMRIKNKGILAPGMDADIDVFRPEELHELATYENPRQMCTGMTHIFVNGQPAILNGEFTGGQYGQVIR